MIKLPPYSKNLYELIKKGGRPPSYVTLYIGLDAWNKGKYFSNEYPDRILVLPAWECPSIYFWPVKGCDVLIYDTGYADEDYVNDLTASLFIYEANIVFFSSHELFTTFKKGKIL